MAPRSCDSDDHVSLVGKEYDTNHITIYVTMLVDQLHLAL